MAFNYPTFNEPLDGQRSWSGVFESYDQRNDDVYYTITISEGGVETARFIAQVSVAWAGDNWETPEFAARLHKELQQIAASGKSNTSYTGGGVVPNR